ncbi:hypothetical protein QQP08_022571 [Theobroma cacao]|nr:hypothetical protein QQP08_022571 [Theobroma cacao]
MQFYDRHSTHGKLWGQDNSEACGMKGPYTPLWGSIKPYFMRSLPISSLFLLALHPPSTTYKIHPSPLLPYSLISGEVLNKDLVKLLERSWAYNSGRQSSETFSSRRRHWPSYFR